MQVNVMFAIMEPFMREFMEEINEENVSYIATYLFLAFAYKNW